MRERILIGLLIAAMVGCFSFLLFQAGVMHGSAEVMDAWNKQKQEMMLAESAAMQKRIAENGAKQPRVTHGSAQSRATSAEGTKSDDPATSGTDLFYEDRLRHLFDLLQRADEVTASCRALQTFITENGLVKDD